jgi:hypothetical protein
MQHHQMPTKATYSLAPHWVPFICHCATTDLRAFERLFYFLEVCQQTQIRADFVGGCPQRSEWGKDIYINFAGIGLRGHRVGKGEAGE